MASIIDMEDMRYLNLFGKITNVRTRFCLKYNRAVIFCVPRKLVSKAIGENGRNMKKINAIIGKRVKVVSSPENIYEIKSVKRFIEDVISPITFKDLNFDGNEIILTAGNHNKAILIGRNKQRLFELQKISRDYFGKELKLV